MKLLFVIQFSVGVFLLTLFLSLHNYVVAQLIIAIFIGITYVYFTRNKKYTTGLLVSMLGVFLAFLAVFLEYSVVSSQVFLTEGASRSGVVVGGRRGGVYVLSTTGGNYFLRDVFFDIPYGSTIEVSGSFSDISTDSHTMFSAEKSYTLGSFDYDMRRWTKGFVGDIYRPTVRFLSPSKSSFLSYKRDVIQYLKLLFGEKRGSLLSGLLIGDLLFMDTSFYNLFLESSLVHIVAVSGGNLVFIATLLHMFFFYFPFYIRALLVVLGLVLFSYFVGLDSSLLRALSIALIVGAGFAFGRKVSFLHSLGLAWCLLLYLSPYVLLYDVGFLLSFSAVLGIYTIIKLSALYEKYKEVQIPLFLKAYFLPTIGATYGTLPVLLFFIGPINVVGLVANIVVVPIIPCVLVTGIFSTLLQSTFLGTYSHALTSFLLNAVYDVGLLASTYPISIGGEPQANYVLVVCLLLCYFIVYLIYMHFKNAWIGTKTTSFGG